jgi:NodT family efflux transporter outer membrane factor (OMF) lipoprotein
VPAKYESLPGGKDEAPLSEPRPEQADLSEWWTQFQDSQLQGLVMRALQANLDLQAAASRIRQAREQEIIAGAGHFPSLSATVLGARLHSKSNLLGAFGGRPAGANSPTTLEFYSAGFDATWELDVFGGTRRSIQAARANTEAAVWQFRDAQVSLSAEVANVYLTLRTAQARIAIVQASAQRQQDLLDLTEARARAGFVTELDVNQQRAQLAATNAQLPPLEAETRATVDALSVLLGQEPGAFASELGAAGPLPSVPTTLPVGLPSDLLRRRPDIRRAERQLAAATAQVGVAVANLYPKFNLIAAASIAANSAGDLFSSRNSTNIALGMITWPLFQAGRIRANVRATREQQMQAYLAYRKSVLAALQDAEDALTRCMAEQRRLGSLLQSQEAADSSLHIAEDQYRAGLVPFINVLVSTASLLQAQDQVAQSRQALAQDVVSVYKALGGGWSTSAP